MRPDLILPLITFAFVSSITPGPNNLMLLTSGLNFGMRRTLPHMLGVGIGFTVMIMIVGLGLGEVFKLYPFLLTILKYAGAAYILWLAWKISQSGPVEGDGEVQGKPMTFLQAAAFQWVNPKAWIMAVSAIATYTVPQNFTASVLVVSLIFGVTNLPCIASWAMFGAGLKRFLNDPKIIRIFNYVMAVLLIASLWPIFAEFV